MSIDQRCRIIASVASVDRAAGGDDGLGCARVPARRSGRDDHRGAISALCSALKFIGSEGPKLLRTRRLGWRGRPAWLWGVRSEIRRDPHGKVLVLGTWNYPVFLVGVQVAQALAAGNDVWLKPAIGCEAISDQLAKSVFMPVACRNRRSAS